MVSRAHFVWALVGASQYFVPNQPHFPAPAQPPVEPPQFQDAAMMKRHIVAPEAQRGPENDTSAWKSSAFMFGALAAAAGVSVVKGARLSRQERRAEPLLMQATADPEAPVAMAATGGSEAGGAMEMTGLSVEVGGGLWDPLGFNKITNDATMNWFRHAELKHGRVCMAAFVGWLVQVSGGHFQGYFDMDHQSSFAALSKLGAFDAWYGIPEKGRLQIIFLIGCVEWCTEFGNGNGHYTKAGNPGDLTFVKVAGVKYPTIKVPAEKQAQYELAELKHGRLAMIGMASIFSAMAIPGSVPFLSATGIGA